MRLLIWSQHYWPETFGINQLAATLVRNGHEVTVLTGKPNYPEGRIYVGYAAGGLHLEEHEGVRIVRIPMFPRGVGTAWRLTLNYLSFISSGFVLAPFALRGRRFDAVFVYATSPLLQALPALWISWLKRAPLCIWVQDLWPESLRATGFVRSPMLLSVVSRVVRSIYRRSDSILVQSEAFRHPVAKICGQPAKISYFPNPSSSSSVDLTGEPLPYGLKAKLRGKFSVVFAGNIGKVQSVQTILLAAQYLATVPDIHFHLVGAGSEAGTVFSMIAAMQLGNVSMTGALPQTAMPALFQAASALLVTLAPNPALDATVPSKVQAYLCAGKPIIASMNGEGARLVQVAEAGLICPAGDARALAECALTLYRMTPHERHQMGANGKLYATTYFDLDSRAHELVSHLVSLKSNPPPRI